MDIEIKEKNSQKEREMLTKDQDLKLEPFQEIKRKDWMGYSLLVALLVVSVVSGLLKLDIISYSSLVLFSGLIIKAFFNKPKK